MSFTDKIESAYKAFNGPDQEKLFNESKKLDNKIDNKSPLQKSITKLTKKIEKSNTSEERYILEEQVNELEKINNLYQNNIKKHLTKTTKKEIQSLLIWLEPQINSKENILEDDYENLENIFNKENKKLEDTIDIISANTIRDTIENNINILWIKESLPKEQYQEFFDIATVTYIDILEEIENNNNQFAKNQLDFLIKNKWLYLDFKWAQKFIKELIKKLDNKNLNFDFEMKLKKQKYEKTFTVNLQNFKEKEDNFEKVKIVKEKENIKKDNSKIIEKNEEDNNKIEEELFILNWTLDFIIKHEWFTHISKWDRTQYSRWYSTQAPWKGKYISRAKAKEELSLKVWKVKSYIDKNFPHLNKFQKIALISFFYNNWTSSIWKTNLIYRIKNMNKNIKWVWLIKPKSVANMILKYDYSWWKRLKWLTKRRKLEAELFLKES